MYALTMVRASSKVWPLARSAYMGWVIWGSDTVALLQHRKHRQHRQQAKAAAVGGRRGLLLCLLVLVSWSSSGPGAVDAGVLAAGNADLATARAIASGQAPMPLRAEA